ncbi:MAG: 5'-methylthioadenosine/adenosylhomocysteine nucleosidase [Alphaproteobacteria bacterium]|nr:5'-methylthioadenosine/adenosylhomocysteine nucleosidase [Alphaproteobacteria bacterium]
MKIAIIVAMTTEYQLISSLLSNQEIKKINHLDFTTGTIGDKSIVLMKSNIGKVNAAVAMVELIRNFAPDYIINSGIAGGLDKSLSVMDIVVGTNIVYHDVWCGEGDYGQIQGMPTYYHSDKKIVEAVKKVKADVKIHEGLIATGDFFISELERLNAIKNKFPEALACDMESGACAQVAYLYNVPYASIRIISDTPGIENHYEQYLDFWNKAPQVSAEILKKIIANIS